MAQYNGSGLGWTFNAELDDQTGAPLDGNLALTNVRHDGHNFAHDLRVIGAWIKLEHVDGSGQVLKTESLQLPLDSKSFKVSPVKTLIPKPVTRRPTRNAPNITPRTFDFLAEVDSALNFSEYFKDPSGNYVAYGVATTYDGSTILVDKGFTDCEYVGLRIKLQFLFARYSDEPPHEPSGALAAARFHPLLSYELIVNQTTDHTKPHTRLSSIRFDYRLYLYLDTHLADKTASGLWSANQAGLFADSDVGTIRASLKNITFRGKTKLAFFAIEKPLVREVTAPGLIKGESKGNLGNAPDDYVCWDNFHWWGADAPGMPMISAPGAFHAAHLHWRWGEILDSLVGHLLATAWRRFQPGQPLLDPRIPLQTILVAVTKYSRNLDPKHVPLTSLSKESWEDLFHSKKGVPSPDLIKNGADLVFWYSTEVHRKKDEPLADGTVFLHGFFFAHNVEPGSSIDPRSTVGSRDPGYWPRKESEVKDWFRPASD
jgi:hypothetical protein